MTNQENPQNLDPIHEHNVGLRKERLYLAIIIILTVAIAFMGYILVKKGDTIDSMSILIEGEKSEKEDVKSELEDLYSDFNALDTENDNLNQQIEEQKAKIGDYLAQIERGNYDRYKLKKETETLRTIMKGYIRQIDSLNQVNKALNTELDFTKEELATTETERDELSELSKQQQLELEKGATLRATGIAIQGIQVTSSGKQKETARAKKANTIKACAVINENKIAKAGNKWIYIRVLSPSGKVYSPKKGAGEMPTPDGVERYSAKRQIDYQNQDLDVCIYWENTGSDLSKGTYVVEFWADGYKIGQEDLYLK